MKSDNENERGLTCEIFRWSLGECSNGGISSRCNKVVLIGLGRSAQVFEPGPDCPAVRIVKRTIGRSEYLHAEPVDQPEGLVGPMSGGTFIYSCDSRFPWDYPIALHDRWETQQDYDALSR
jgi:hypothetical protein